MFGKHFVEIIQDLFVNRDLDLDLFNRLQSVEPIVAQETFDSTLRLENRKSAYRGLVGVVRIF